MPKDDLVYVGQMLDTARKALGKVAGKTREQFDQDEDLRIVLVHLIQTVGEAARRVSKDFCEANPQIPWRAIVSMRHKIVHDYMDIDEDAVWKAATEELEPLVRELELLLPADDEAG